MRMCLTAATLLAGLAAAPALADKGASGNCRAYAESLAFTGSKGGYQARYVAAYNDCLGHGHVVRYRYHEWGGGYYRQPRPQHNIAVRCAAGSPPMVGGTLYCVN